jgi:hypothetical protein
MISNKDKHQDHWRRDDVSDLFPRANAWQVTCITIQINKDTGLYYTQTGNTVKGIQGAG